jgi:hypothetical protein
VHKNRDLWVVMGPGCAVGGPAISVAIWAVAKTAFWAHPAEITGGVVGLFGVVMVVALVRGWWLPGGLVETGNIAALPSTSRFDDEAPGLFAEPAEQRKDRLLPGERLSVGESLWSPDGTVRVHMGRDGNLAVSCGTRVLWDSQTAQTGGANCLEFRQDGSMVLCIASGAPLIDWKATGMGAHVLVIQDDGNLVLYAPLGRVVWASDRLKDGTVVVPFGQNRARPVRLITFAPGNL